MNPLDADCAGPGPGVVCLYKVGSDDGLGFCMVWQGYFNCSGMKEGFGLV